MVAQFNIFKPPDLIQFQVAADTAYCHKIEQNKITVSWIVWRLNREICSIFLIDI